MTKNNGDLPAEVGSELEIHIQLVRDLTPAEIDIVVGGDTGTLGTIGTTTTTTTITTLVCWTTTTTTTTTGTTTTSHFCPFS